MVKLYGLSPYPVTTAPQAYDIVSAAFPYQEHPSKPGPKLRPSLVLSVSAHTDEKLKQNYATLQVAYGTSSKLSNISKLDLFHVHNYVALQRSGLSKNTYFRLDRILTLMWCGEFFPIIDKFETPIMGHLPQEHILSLKTQKEIRDDLRSQGIKW